MNFKEFATNYLNPVFLMYRAVLLGVAGGMLLFSLPLYVSSANATVMGFVFGSSFIFCLSLVKYLKHRPYLLYLVIPFVFSGIAFVIRGDDAPEQGVLWLPMIIWNTAVLITAWNGIRSWGYGISLNDINNRLN